MNPNHRTSSATAPLSAKVVSHAKATFRAPRAPRAPCIPRTPHTRAALVKAAKSQIILNKIAWEQYKTDQRNFDVAQSALTDAMNRVTNARLADADAETQLGKATHSTKTNALTYARHNYKQTHSQLVQAQKVLAQCKLVYDTTKFDAAMSEEALSRYVSV